MQESIYLKSGKVILYPTDTIWGLGCDALNVKAIERIKQIKGRDNSKSFILLMRDLDMVKNYVQTIPPAAMELINNISTPLTIIYPQAINLPIEHLSTNNSIGIRIPKSNYLQSLFKEFPFPIVSTSANFSSQKSPANFAEIDPELIKQVDFVASIDQENSSYNHASSIYLIDNNGQKQKIR